LAPAPPKWIHMATKRKMVKMPDELGKLANVVMKQNKKKENARRLKHK
jgi:hypothetical protein